MKTKIGWPGNQSKAHHHLRINFKPNVYCLFFSNTMQSISVIHCPQSDYSVWRRNLIWVVARHARTEREKTEKRLHITARCQKAFGKHFDIHRWEYVNPVFISPFSDDARLNYLISVHMASCKNRLSKAFYAHSEWQLHNSTIFNMTYLNLIKELTNSWMMYGDLWASP